MELVIKVNQMYEKKKKKTTNSHGCKITCLKTCINENARTHKQRGEEERKEKLTFHKTTMFEKLRFRQQWRKIKNQGLKFDRSDFQYFTHGPLK